MSFASGNTGSVALPAQKPLGIATTSLSTNEQARPLPVLFGLGKIGVTFVSSAFNQRSQPVQEQVAKSDDPITAGYNYYCSFAALVCHGQVDELHAIYFDQVKVWPPSGGDPIVRSGEDFVTVTIVGWGTWRFYWGTETQDFDPLLLTLSANVTRNPGGVIAPNVAEEHPAYTGQCYLVSTQFLGYQKTQVPNIEVVVGRFPVVPGGYLSARGSSGDCGLGTIIVESMTNQRYGLGLFDADADNTRFDHTGIDAFEQELSDEGLSISPLINRVQPWQQVLVQILEYVDGFYSTLANGKFTLGLMRKIDCNDAALPRFDENDLTDLPDVAIESWTQTQNQVWVSFVNRDVDYNDDSTPGNASGNLQATGEPSATVLARPWVTSAEMADTMARVAAKILALPKITGSLRIRKSRRQGLSVGAGFYFNYSQYNLCWLHCRALSISQPDPFKPELQIDFEVDRGYAAKETYTPPTFTPPGVLIQTPVAIASQMILELPYVTDLKEKPYLAAMAGRPSQMTRQFGINYKVDSSHFTFVLRCDSFCFTGALNADYSATATGDVSFTLSGSDTTLDIDLSSAQADADTWLLFLGDEIFSIYNITLVSGASYTASVKRERFDTKKFAHTSGSVIFITARTSMTSQLVASPGSSTSGVTATFKLQPSVLGQSLDLSDATEVSATFSDRVRRPWKPKGLSAPATWSGSPTISVTWTKVNRDGTDFPPGFEGPLWYIDVRSASASFSFTTPTTGQVLLYKAIASAASQVVKATEVAAALGSMMNIKVRIWAVQNGFQSRNYDEVSVTYP